MHMCGCAEERWAWKERTSSILALSWITSILNHLQQKKSGVINLFNKYKQILQKGLEFRVLTRKTEILSGFGVCFFFFFKMNMLVLIYNTWYLVLSWSMYSLEIRCVSATDLLMCSNKCKINFLWKKSHLMWPSETVEKFSSTSAWWLTSTDSFVCLEFALGCLTCNNKKICLVLHSGEKITKWESGSVLRVLFLFSQQLYNPSKSKLDTDRKAIFLVEKGIGIWSAIFLDLFLKFCFGFRSIFVI